MAQWGTWSRTLSITYNFPLLEAQNLRTGVGICVFSSNLSHFYFIALRFSKTMKLFIPGLAYWESLGKFVKGLMFPLFPVCINQLKWTMKELTLRLCITLDFIAMYLFSTFKEGSTQLYLWFTVAARDTFQPVPWYLGIRHNIETLFMALIREGKLFLILCLWAKQHA